MKASKIFIFAALLSVTILAGACILSETEPESPAESPKEPIEEPKERIDTLSHILWFNRGKRSFSKLDVFLYDNTLKLHRVIYEQDSLHITLEKDTEYTVVAVANIRGEFNDKAVQHYDAWDAFEINLTTENPEHPIMGAIGKISANTEGQSEIELTSLICTIEIRSVTHLLSDDTLIENPRVHLTNRSTKSRLLSRGNIAPSEQEDSETIFLPSDIGVYTQYPGVKLYSYPNEVASTASSPATEIVLEYEINGTTKQYKQTVHPLQRGCWEMIDIEIQQ